MYKLNLLLICIFISSCFRQEHLLHNYFTHLEPEQAIIELKKEKAKYPANDEINYHLGICYLKISSPKDIENYKLAITEFENAINNNDTKKNKMALLYAYKLYSNSLFEEKKYEDDMIIINKYILLVEQLFIKDKKYIKQFEAKY